MPVSDVLELRSGGSLHLKDGIKSSKKASVRSSRSPQLTSDKREIEFGKLKVQDHENHEVKVVYNHREASWLNDVGVIPIAPCFEDDDRVDTENQQKSKWKWVPIRNSSRSRTVDSINNDLTLYHWIDTTKEEESSEYKFSCFDQRPRILRYTDEEYETYLQHPEWTRHETDVLFELCEEYDLRFLVVHDRYNPILSSELDDARNNPPHIIATSNEFYTGPTKSELQIELKNSSQSSLDPPVSTNHHNSPSLNQVQALAQTGVAATFEKQNQNDFEHHSSSHSIFDDPDPEYETDDKGLDADDGNALLVSMKKSILFFRIK